MLTVYTAIYWWYDVPIPFVKQDMDCRFICFTDKQYYTEWDLVIKDFNLPDHLKSRYCKTHSHSLPFVKDWLSIWVDGNVVIDRPDFVSEIVKNYKWGFLCIKNDERGNIKEEMDILRTKERFQDQIGRMDKLEEFYKNEWYNYDNWLSRNCVVARENTLDIVEANRLWWDMILEYSYRDMLSMEYVSRKTKTPIHHLTWEWVQNKYMHTRYHLNLKY